MVYSTPLAPPAPFNPLRVWKGGKIICFIALSIGCGYYYSMLLIGGKIVFTYGLECLPTRPVHQMFFLGFLPAPPDLRVHNTAFLLVRGSLAFFLTLVRLCFYFGFSASLLVRCSPTCRFFTHNTLHCKFQRNIFSFLSLFV